MLVSLNDITHDANKIFMAEAFPANANLLEIWAKSISVETAKSMTTVATYHLPSRRTFKVIRRRVWDIDTLFVLQMAIKAINDSTGSVGLDPTLLVHGA